MKEDKGKSLRGGYGKRRKEEMRREGVEGKKVSEGEILLRKRIWRV